jgi:hypothetical protein
MGRPGSACPESCRASKPVALARPRRAAKRAVGLLVLLLVISGIWPLPLINVVPAAMIALLAIALLQEDGLLLAVSLLGGILSLLVFGFLVWKSADALENLFSSSLHMPGGKAERRRLRRFSDPENKRLLISEPIRLARVEL